MRQLSFLRRCLGGGPRRHYCSLSNWLRNSGLLQRRNNRRERSRRRWLGDYGQLSQRTRPKKRSVEQNFMVVSVVSWCRCGGSGSLYNGSRLLDLLEFGLGLRRLRLFAFCAKCIQLDRLERRLLESIEVDSSKCIGRSWPHYEKMYGENGFWKYGENPLVKVWEKSSCKWLGKNGLKFLSKRAVG